MQRISTYIRERGLRVVMCVDRPHIIEFAKEWASDLVDHWICGATPDEALLDAGDVFEFRCCFSYDEFGIELAAALAERLHLRHTSRKAVREVQNKHNFRNICNSRGMIWAGSTQVHSAADLKSIQGPFPKVLKPTRGGGSYWCRKVATERELAMAYAELAPQLAASASIPQRIKEDGFVV